MGPWRSSLVLERYPASQEGGRGRHRAEASISQNGTPHDQSALQRERRQVSTRPVGCLEIEERRPSRRRLLPTEQSSQRLRLGNESFVPEAARSPEEKA